MNLISLIEASKNMEPEIFEKYKFNKNISIKEYEIRSLEKMVNNIKTLFTNSYYLMKQLDNFSIGYSIKQIGKEFDLLRIGENYNINIELKSEFTSTDKIKKQIQKNNYYLKSLQNETYILTFIESENRFVELDNDDIIDVSSEKVCELISKQKIEFIDNTSESIDLYFNPSNFLVSPFNLTDEFIKGEYFLSPQQDEIKKELFDNYLMSQFKISIKGAAGTGKTLLTYDIAKTLMQSNNSVLIIHCGILNEGHNRLRKLGWNICGAKSMNVFLTSNIDVIIVDESQRINNEQLEYILQFIDNTNTTCIFSHDYAQCLHNSEINREMSKRIIQLSDKKYGLKEKIRTNAEMAKFIKLLLNPKLFNHDLNYNFNNHVNIEYFSNMDAAKEFIEVLRSEDWNYINYTNSLYTSDPFDESIISHVYDNSHKVVGQEFEKVAVVLNQNFFYRDGRLNGTTSSYYNSMKMLFQILTRTKNKLYLIIVNNENLLKDILFLLDGQIQEISSKPERTSIG